MVTQTFYTLRHNTASIMKGLVYQRLKSDVLQRSGVRAKLQTADGNHIDTMFFDRRGM